MALMVLWAQSMYISMKQYQEEVKIIRSDKNTLGSNQQKPDQSSIRKQSKPMIAVSGNSENRSKQYQEAVKTDPHSIRKQ